MAGRPLAAVDLAGAKSGLGTTPAAWNADRGLAIHDEIVADQFGLEYLEQKVEWGAWGE